MTDLDLHLVLKGLEVLEPSIDLGAPPLPSTAKAKNNKEVVSQLEQQQWVHKTDITVEPEHKKKRSGDLGEGGCDTLCTLHWNLGNWVSTKRSFKGLNKQKRLHLRLCQLCLTLYGVRIIKEFFGLVHMICILLIFGSFIPFCLHSLISTRARKCVRTTTKWQRGHSRCSRAQVTCLK